MVAVMGNWQRVQILSRPLLGLGAEGVSGLRYGVWGPTWPHPLSGRGKAGPVCGLDLRGLLLEGGGIARDQGRRLDGSAGGLEFRELGNIRCVWV